MQRWRGRQDRSQTYNMPGSSSTCGVDGSVVASGSVNGSVVASGGVNDSVVASGGVGCDCPGVNATGAGGIAAAGKHGKQKGGARLSRFNNCRTHTKINLGLAIVSCK